jgi:hypothetical protein
MPAASYFPARETAIVAFNAAGEGTPNNVGVESPIASPSETMMCAVEPSSGAPATAGISSPALHLR